MRKSNMHFQSSNGQELKVDQMFKRSQGKKKILTTYNYKERVFVLTPKALRYYGGTKEKRGKLKGQVDLIKVKACEPVDERAFDKPYCFQEQYFVTEMHYQNARLDMIYPRKPEGGRGIEKNQKMDYAIFHQSAHYTKCFISVNESPLRVVYQEYILYIIANDEEQKVSWIEAVHDELRKNKFLFSFYHPRAFITGQWTCCNKSERTATGCKETFISMEKKGTTHQSETHMPEKPLPPLPTSNESWSRQNVVALYSFRGQETDDLSFEKGDEFTILKSEGEHWWLARDRTGRTGYIPVNYVRQKGGLGTEVWYFGDITRHVAEEMLLSEGQQGCFVVRNSSKEGMFTLSLLHGDSVKHYHIKQGPNNFYKISERHCFPTIPELIEYHKLNSGGLVARLRHPPTSDDNPPTVGLGHDKWEIDRSEICLGEEIGTGQFGRVCRGVWKGSIDVAVKMMKPGSMSEQDFVEEAKLMTVFHHRNLVQLYGVCSEKPIYIVTEYVPNGCLLNYLRNHRETVLKKRSMMVEMVTHVASAMAYLELKNFIHRDLAARNCLVGFNLIVKVCDFGLSRFVIDDEYTASEGTKFPIKWASPEVINYSKFSSKSDIWAYGILMWEVFTAGGSPYAAMSNTSVVRYIMEGNRLKKPDLCPPEIYRLMQSCWIENAEQRPAFSVLFRRLKELSGEDYADTFE